MKRVFVVVILVVVAAVLGLWRTSGGVRNGLSRVVGATAEQQGEAREEIRKSFELQPGARIEVQGINGKVDIQTSDTTTAEVYVVKTAGSREGLARREITVEQTSNGLLVKGKQVSRGFWEHLFHTQAKEEVTIKAPRQIALSLKGINGRTTAGDIDGAVEVKGVNGRVELGQTNEWAEVSGVNGTISFGLNKLSNSGVRLNGINGNIEMRIPVGLNADLSASGMNGNVRSELPDVTINKNEFGSRYTARIGNGGAPITISGINGNVHLTRAASSANNQSTDKKSPVDKQRTSTTSSEK
jgi:hypothetical protein